jgi:hypothetical protein
MGAWGHGILQNDSAQDDLCEVIEGIYGDVIALGKEPTNRKTVARLGAGIGLMLQLSACYWLSEESDHWPELREVLAQHETDFAAVSPEAGRILADVFAGKGEELAARDAPPDARLTGALFAEDSQGFALERKFGYHEPALFADPEAARYVQEVADRLVKVNDEGVIEDARFKTFGCGSAIASSSLATEWIKGKTVEEAETIKNSQIVEELNLPPVKIHCSVLAEDAIKSAIADYRKKQLERRSAPATATGAHPSASVLAEAAPERSI